MTNGKLKKSIGLMLNVRFQFASYSLLGTYEMGPDAIY